ncbi:outer membrane protein assembly factor BamC [Halioxenophilus sp. WMMB6]|uniref:outer membrane protein assembly factor BamC n=1 Tax=Halioxenophilus sp. WMMB6 TaxID=3073815 RepID=UPI00295EC750|nr:outer membrane protein assembly factor BamC [Halioxenophilus sp. WMMB6]
MIVMIKTLPKLPLILAFTSLCSCSLLGDGSKAKSNGDDYLRAEPIAPLKVSPEAQARLQEIYVVPDIDDSGYDYDQEFEVPRPLALSSSVLEDKVKIQRLSGNQWIFITNSPSEVWPQVREFLGLANMDVARTDATKGVIETQWLAFKDSPESIDRFRINIENGVQPDSAEIHILNMRVPRGTDLATVQSWPENSSEPAREAWLVDELSNTLAANLERSSSSLLAQTIGGDSKAYLDKSDSGEPVLRLRLSYVRAWASLLHATEEDGFFLWDKENTLGAMYVAYREPPDAEDKPGWLRRSYRRIKIWFGAEDPTKTPTTPYDIGTLLSHLPDSADSHEVFSKTQNSGQALKDIPGYLLVVRGVDNEIEIRIRDGYAKRIDEKTAKRLLGILRNNLI